MGCDGFHPEVPLDLTGETRGEVVEFLEKMERSGKWPKQACTVTFFLIPKNVTRERPIALHANVDTLVGSLESTKRGEVAAEVSI